jgi:hypothetical protein
MEENEENKSFLIKSAARENLILKLKRKKWGISKEDGHKVKSI